MSEQNLASLQKDSEFFYPSAKALAKSLTPDFDALRAEANADPEAFWDKQARELEWYEPWTQVKNWQPEIPKVEWYVGA